MAAVWFDALQSVPGSIEDDPSSPPPTTPPTSPSSSPPPQNLAAGGSTSFGFIGNVSGTNPAPTGLTCTSP